MTTIAGAEGRQQQTPRRRAVLDALRTSDTPLGVTEVAERLGVHPNTVRFHLDALVTQGNVERTQEEPSGPGRPRTVYAAAPGMDRGGKRSYFLLAQILVSQLASSGPGAKTAALQAGRAWGEYLIDQVPPFSDPADDDESVARLTVMLDDLGFAPEPHGDGDRAERIVLRHCPFLELAEEYGQVVCPLHLGLMQGALTGLDAPVQATRLEPFAQPDACLAHLTRTAAA